MSLSQLIGIVTYYHGLIVKVFLFLLSKLFCFLLLYLRSSSITLLLDGCWHRRMHLCPLVLLVHYLLLFCIFSLCMPQSGQKWLAVFIYFFMFSFLSISEEFLETHRIVLLFPKPFGKNTVFEIQPEKMTLEVVGVFRWFSEEFWCSFTVSDVCSEQ